MDEIEQRLAAVELVLTELIPWLDPGVIDDAAASIRTGLKSGACGDERVIRLQAISILEEGRQRFGAASADRILTAGDLAFRVRGDS